MFVFRNLDDFLFAHGVDFYCTPTDEGPRHRFGFVFRWLDAKRDFFVETNTVKIPELERLERKENKRKSKATKRDKERRQSLRGV